MAVPRGLLSIEVSGARKLRRYFTAIQFGKKDIFTKGKIEELIIKRTRMRFARGGTNELAQKDPDKRSWPRPRQKLRSRIKGKTRDQRQILKDTGALRDSIKAIRGKLATGVASPTGAGVSIGSSLPYARWHQLGEPELKIPRRRFLGIGNADIRAVDKLIVGIMRKRVDRTI